MALAPTTYPKALEGIYALDKFGSLLGLERISAMLEALGRPDKRFRCVLVGGTNGKGSATHMIGAILQREGYRVGTYFSPQVEEFAERIRIGGQNCAQQDVVDSYLQVSSVCRKNGIPATFFEVVTAMALVVFQKREVDFAVLEIGLGGRLDAANAVEPELSVLTSIGLEHTEVLGDTVAKIAHEKCGIARRGKFLVCGQLGKDAKKAVGEECRKIGAIPVFSSDEVKVDKLRQIRGRCSFEAEFGEKPYDISLRAPGKFQVANACSALVACSLLGCSIDAVEKGLASCEPEFRLQKIGSSPTVIADCAHNPQAAVALADEVEGMKAKKKVLLFSAMKDKDFGSMLTALGGKFDHLVITEVSLGRAAKLSELQKAAHALGAKAVAVKKPSQAYELAKEMAGKDGLLVVAGSIYLLGELFSKEKIRIAQ
jgi:dihydrofolate synthase/folylpolyglutamate synthase